MFFGRECGCHWRRQDGTGLQHLVQHRAAGDVNSIRIGNGVNIQDGSVLHTLYEKSTIEIGNHVSVGHNVTIHGATIKDYALVGMGSTILTTP